LLVTPRGFEPRLTD